MIDQRFIDCHGLVKPRTSWEDSGNPYLYTVIYSILNPGTNFYLNKLWQRDLGVLWRTPENTYGQNSHDEYLALAVDHLYIPGTEIPRQVLWSSLKKFGFMQNSFEKGDLWKSQMYRFPHVWIVMLAAAFPNRIVKWVSRSLLRLGLLFTGLNITDASGVQLQWLQRYALILLGDQQSMASFLMKLKDGGTSMSKIMDGYYDSDHPTLTGYREFEKRMLG